MPASATTDRAIGQAWRTLIVWAGKLLALMPSAWAVLNQAKRIPLNVGRWETAVGVVAVLVIACWIGIRDHRPASPPVSSPQGSSALEQQSPFAPAKRVLANSASKPPTVPTHRRTSTTMPQRLRDKNIRVWYISDDVTVRYFTPRPPLQRVQDTNSRLRYISDDVTVRYFTPKTGVAPQNPAERPVQPVDR